MTTCGLKLRLMAVPEGLRHLRRDVVEAEHPAVVGRDEGVGISALIEREKIQPHRPFDATAVDDRRLPAINRLAGLIILEGDARDVAAILLRRRRLVLAGR